MNRQYQSFSEFYPFYLREHSDKTNRLLHFIGTTLVMLVIVWSVWNQQPLWLLATPVLGYGFAWVGHFFYEKNRPATFIYPFYSFLGDWVMWKDILVGKIPLR